MPRFRRNKRIRQQSPEFPGGVEVLHNCPNAAIDICFVHGLSGDSRSTWTAAGHDRPWPQSLLPDILPRARILTYGYNAYIVSETVASTNRVSDYARNLVIDLTNDRESCQALLRPLIFVAHSLGGLVCKDAILKSQTNEKEKPERHCIFDHLIGIIFMGTPHKGSWMADWETLPAKALGIEKSPTKSLLEILKTGNEQLEKLHYEFMRMIREQRLAGRTLEVESFYEALSIDGIGKPVVSKQSATFDGFEPNDINANHIDMVKFRSVNENGFKRVVTYLKRWSNSAIDRGYSKLDAIAPQAHVGQYLAITGGPASELHAEEAGPASKILAEVAGPEQRTKHHLPLRDNSDFVGRKDTIENLKSLLFNKPHVQQVALCGLGGMGKTQISLHFAHLVKRKSQEFGNCSVIWVPAQSMASFEQECTKIVHEFGIEGAGNKDPKETFRDFLNTDEAGKWLLIVDNADFKGVMLGAPQHSGGIRRFLPHSDNGRILFTTRHKEVAVLVARKAVVNLSDMGLEEARALLQNSLIEKKHTQDTIVDELLKKLTHLPLAISQASAYMNANEVSIKKYLDLFDKTDKDMVQLLSQGLYEDSHHDIQQGAVATTWIVSFKQINKTDKGAARLLSFIAYIEPKAIPRTMLPSFATDQQLTKAIGTLCGYGFLTPREDEETFDMHSLVHLALTAEPWNKRNDKNDPKNKQRQAATSHLAEVFPVWDWENREVSRQYLPHALKILSGRINDESKDFCLLGLKVGTCLVSEGRAREAVEIFKLVVEIHKKTLAEDHLDRLASQQALALAYRKNGQFNEAVILLEYVVSIEVKTLAEGHPDRLISQKSLASAYRDNGQINKAVTLLECVVRLRKKTLPEDHPYLLSSQHSLALAYREHRQINKAITLLKHVMAIEKKMLKEDHPYRLASQFSLALAYRDNSQINEAIVLLEHVKKIEEKTLTKTHPDRIASEKLLQDCYNDLDSLGSSSA